MNYNKIYGWYYNNANDKSPSWTGVQFLHNFLVNNQSIGPIGEISNQIEIGDIVQLSFDGINFTHSLIIVEIKDKRIFIASHTFDSYGREVSSYEYKKIRFIHINGVNKT